MRLGDGFDFLNDTLINALASTSPPAGPGERALGDTGSQAFR